MTMQAHLQSAFQAANQKAKLDQFFTPESLQNMTAGQAAVRKQFPDVQWHVESVVEKGSRIAFRYTVTGTHPSTNKKITWGGTATGFVVGGKVHVTHVDEDHLGAKVGNGVFPTTPEDDMTGNWNGDLWGVPFNLQANEAPGQNVVHGVISSLGQTLPVTGTNNPPNVSLTGNTKKGNVTLTGTWQNGNTINGMLNGAGFTNQPIVLTR
ncbi:MAG TPA: nuclear transport factor 2 family protein [Myxococcaceae bacterium]|jgi:predicted ester cyclase